MPRLPYAGLALATVIFASAAAISGVAYAAEPQTYAFQLKVGSTKCTVEYPREDGTTLYLLLTKDQAFNAGVYRPRWEIVDDKDSNNQDHHLTLEFQGVGKTASKWGGYDNGFNQGVWGAWDSGSGGANTSGGAMDLLKQTTVITVNFEGQVLGTFDMKQKGFAANLLKNCVAHLS